MKRGLCLVLLLIGCAENAVLELELDLPATPCASAAALEARIPEAGGECFFEQEWLDGDRAVLALGSTPRVSLVARGAEVERPLCLRIRACTDEDECPPGDVAFGARTEIEIDRAFYLGRFTELSLGPIDLCADASARVPRCEVRGCADGARDTFCRPDGRHLCE